MLTQGVLTESLPQSCMALLMIMTVMSCQRTERSVKSSQGLLGLMPLVSACSWRISSSSQFLTSQPRRRLRASGAKKNVCIAFWEWNRTKINKWLSLWCNKKASSSLTFRAMFTHAWAWYIYAPLIQASLSPRSMSRYLGLSGNQGRVTSWMKPGMALLARRYCQQGSLPKISLWINNPEGHGALLCTLVMKGPCASFEGSRQVGMQVPEADHLAQHDPERRENSWRQGDGAAQMLGCTFPKVHGLHIHANSCCEDKRHTNL